MNVRTSTSTKRATKTTKLLTNILMNIYKFKMISDLKRSSHRIELRHCFSQVLIMGRVGKSYTSDMAIDDISFVNGTCDGLPLFSAVTRQNIPALKQEGEFGKISGSHFDTYQRYRLQNLRFYLIWLYASVYLY